MLTRFKIILALWLSPFLFANAAVVKFNHLDVRDGLPDNAIRDIEQDRLGYIWFATELGLARYDGISVKSYVADMTKPNSIPDSYIRSIEIDSNGTLWVSSGKSGLAKYNRDSDDFTVYTHNINDRKSLSSNSVQEILHSKDNTLWVATDKGIDRFNTELETFEHFSHYIGPTSEGIAANNGSIRALVRDSKGRVWVGSSKGLAFYNESLNGFMLVNLVEGTQPEVLSIAEGVAGEIWIGTKVGLFQYKNKLNHIRKFEFKEDVERVHSLLFDEDNQLWVGTSQFGIFRIDSQGSVINIKPDRSDKHSMTDPTIFDIIKDHSGMIWLATYRAGVNYFNPKSLNFGTTNNSSNSLVCLNSNDIRSALALDNEIFLLGTAEGITRVNTKSRACSNHQHKANNPSTISGKAVYALHQDTNKDLWVGTTNGLDKFIANSNSFERQIDTSEHAQRIGVYEVVESSKHLLLATNSGAFKFKPSTKELRKLKSSNGILEKSFVFSIDIDSNQVIWIATTKGLFSANNDLDTLVQIKPNNFEFADHEIWGMASDEENNIWLAIEEQGLFKYLPALNKLESIGAKLDIGLKNGFGQITSVGNNVWLATYNQGLFKINIHSNEVKNYRSSDGLHSELFNINSYTEFPDGRLLFGGKTGFNLFHPENIREIFSPPIVSLTDAKRFGKRIIPHQDYDGLMIREHISNLESLSLSHRDTIFGFEFIAMDYLEPKEITYSYLLEGFDKDWTQASAQNRGVTYNNVSPGEYTFRVKAKNSRGIWSEKDVALAVSIAPAPWLTWWAYTFYAITTIFLIWFTFNKRTQWLKKRAAELENTVNVRTKELATEKEKVEQLLSRKNEEFANVSHEFRTPLTLILGPINQLVTKSKDKNLVGKLNIVQRNALRLLRMVDQLLNLETFRVKAITQKSPQAIGKITQLVAEAFADLAEEKQITFNIGTIEPVCFDFTPDAFEKIILNLLSNAIKYTKPGGTITVCTTRIDQAQYQIRVSDTGIGIAKDKLEKVFERFNRVMDENSEQVTGSGIGLALVKSLVESHDGSVELESELGQGTTITVTLPIINEVDESQINVHQNDEIIAMELMNVSSSGLHESSIAQSAETIQSSGKPTVLVIEDNDDMRQYIVESIGQQFNTLVAADGQAGLELAIQEVPDLIISDIMMPKLDGYQTTKALREAQITNHIPVVLLTARGDRDSRLKGWEEKADEYITKPFDVEELIIRISNLIEIRNILKRRFSETVFEQTEQARESLVQEMDGDSESLSIVEINTRKLQQEFINQLNQQIESVYMNAELGVIDLAKSVNMSERQFYRKLKSVIDMTPSEYLRRFRLEKSKEVLRSGKTANFTAFEVGFSSQAYFSKCFKAQYNLTPKQFVNQK